MKKKELLGISLWFLCWLFFITFIITNNNFAEKGIRGDIYYKHQLRNDTWLAAKRGVGVWGNTNLNQLVNLSFILASEVGEEIYGSFINMKYMLACYFKSISFILEEKDDEFWGREGKKYTDEVMNYRKYIKLIPDDKKSLGFEFIIEVSRSVLGFVLKLILL